MRYLSRRGLPALGGLVACLMLVPTPSQAAEPADGDFVCAAHDGSGWSEIAGGPNTYIVGNCRDGWHLARTFKSAVIAGRQYEGGYIGGDYNGCGTLLTTDDRLINNTHNSICTSSQSQDPAGYIRDVDCRSSSPGNCAWDQTLSGDTSTVELKACQAYANARPFSERGASGIDPVQTLDPHRAGENIHRFRWRYITRDGRMVLGHDITHAPHEPAWVFVDVGCVSTPHATTR